MNEPKAGPKPYKWRWWHWRSLVCLATWHDPVSDFYGNAFCWFCNAQLPGVKAKQTAAERIGLR